MPLYSGRGWPRTMDFDLRLFWMENYYENMQAE
jgi:hypothetical protein